MMDVMEGIELRVELNRLVDEKLELTRKVVSLAERAAESGDKFTLDRALKMADQLLGRKHLPT